MRFPICLAPAFMAAFVGACSAGLHSSAPAVQTYLLKAAPRADPPAERPGKPTASIQVSRPQARPGLDTERIAVIRPNHRGDYYAAAQWAGAVPDVVESLVIDRLRSAGTWSVVQGSTTAFPADYLLQMRMLSFDAEYADEKTAPRITVAMDCTLGRRADREVLAAFAVAATVAAEENRLGSVVAAFEAAVNAALDQLDTQAAAALRTSQVR